MTEIALRGVLDLAQGVRSRAWIVGWWAGGRLLVLATSAALHFVGPRGLIGHYERISVIGSLGSWDGRWYRTVAANGYMLEPGRQSDPAFFPLFPILLRGLHALGVDYLVGGVVLSSLAFLGALIAFEQLTCELFGVVLARRSTVYLAVFPMGFVFSMAYPESIVFLLVTLAALAALRGRWLWTAAALGVATLTRPEVALLSLPLVPLVLHEPDGRRRGLAVGGVLAPIAALSSFAVYLGRRLGDPLAWTHAERAWGRHFTPFGSIRAIEGVAPAVAHNAWIVRDVSFFSVYLALLVVALARGVPRLWVLAGVLIVVLPTFSGSFQSVSRFGLLVPAIFWGLAVLGKRAPIDAAIRWISAALLVGGTISLAYVYP